MLSGKQASEPLPEPEDAAEKGAAEDAEYVPQVSWKMHDAIQALDVL